jgi:hypothetical protein
LLIAINPHFDNWYFKPSVGVSGDIIFGCDSSKFQIESSIEHQFSLTLNIKNIFDLVSWSLTIIYGPIDSSLKIYILG